MTYALFARHTNGILTGQNKGCSTGRTNRKFSQQEPTKYIPVQKSENRQHQHFIYVCSPQGDIRTENRLEWVYVLAFSRSCNILLVLCVIIVFQFDRPVLQITSTKMCSPSLSLSQPNRTDVGSPAQPCQSLQYRCITSSLRDVCRLICCSARMLLNVHLGDNHT